MRVGDIRSLPSHAAARCGSANRVTSVANWSTKPLHELSGAFIRDERRPEALQRNPPRGRKHLATDVDADAAGPRTGRAGHAHRVPDHSAARRLRVDETW